jgi:hypothetical protein
MKSKMQNIGKPVSRNEQKNLIAGADVRCRSTRQRDVYYCCAVDRPDWACWYQVDV